MLGFGSFLQNSSSEVFILEEVKVLCFDALLQVFILKMVTRGSVLDVERIKS